MSFGNGCFPRIQFHTVAGPPRTIGVEITPNHRTRHPIPCLLDQLSLQELSLVSGRTGHILSPPVSPVRFRSRWDAAHPPKAIRWSLHLKSALLPASWPPGCNSTARGTNLVVGGTIVWMCGHVTVGQRPANRARQFQMGLT